MKRKLNKALAIFLGVIVLISSSGVVLASHQCFSKPETDVSLFSHNGCCSKKKKKCHALPVCEKAFAKKCCQLTITFHKIDVSSIDHKVNILSLTSFALPVPFNREVNAKGVRQSCFLNKAPPKPAGRILLTNISLLQI